MIINFSPLAAESQAAADGNGVSIEVADLLFLESTMVPFEPAPPVPAPCDYPQELTHQPGYIASTSAKPFKEEAPYLAGLSGGLNFSVLARALEGDDDPIERKNIINSGLGSLPSEFFPEAA